MRILLGRAQVSRSWRRSKEALGCAIHLAAALVCCCIANLADAKPFVVYGDKSLPPYEFLDNGVPKGAMVDLIDELSKRMGRTPEVILTQWDQSQAAILAGKGDALSLMTRTPEREANYDFSDDTFQVSFSLFTLAERRAKINLGNLAGLRIGVTNGGYPQALLRRTHPEAELVTIEDSADGIRRVLRRELDAVAGNTWPLEYFLAELNISGIRAVSPPLEIRFGAVAVPKGRSPELLIQINAALAAIKADGTLDGILDKWSGEKVYVVSRDAVARMILSSATAVLVLLLVVAGIAQFRRQRRALATAVAQRRRSETALRESETLFESVFNTTACGIVLLEADGQYRQANERYCQITGYSVDELVLLKADALTHPDDADEQDCFSSDLYDQSDSFRIEKRYIRKDGKIIWVEVNCAPVRDASGTVRYHVGILQDITLRKQVEAALQQSTKELALAHDRLTAAVQASPAMVFTQDRELRYTFVENSALAFGDEDVIGKTDAELLDRAEDAAHIMNVKRWVFDSGQSAREEVGLSIGGELNWYDLSVRPQFEYGRIVGILGTAVDTTQRHNSELRLRDAMAAAARADNAKSRFLAAASHDLRQPLSALRVYASSLKRHVNTPGQEMLSNMQDCIGSLSELLTDLLDLSKLEAGVVTPTVSDFLLTEVFAQLASIHGPEAEVRGLRLRVRPTRQTVHTDAVLLQRILGNLLANAVRYTKKGGVLVGCRQRQGKLWVEVWDTGVGIPKDKTEEIFEEFRQLDDDARTRGSGLGLTIVARTAELLGLKVRVRSRPGKGSMFAIEVPPGDMAKVHHPADQPQDDSRARLRIAVVEDNHAVREALVLSLQSEGHSVVSAASGKELLRRLGDFDADVLIADYRLQGETGFEVLRAAETILGADLPAILLTGDTDPRLVRSMADRGVAVLHKPVNLDTLHTLLKEATSSSMRT